MSADDHLERLAVLAGRSWSSEVLAHARSEPVVRVTTTDGREPALDVVVRRVGAARGVDLTDEGRATVTAAEIGVGPPVLEWQPENGLLVVAYVTGRKWTTAARRDQGSWDRVASALRRLHAAPPFDQDLDLLASARTYPALVDHPLLARIESALGARPEPRVPCHNDAVPPNMIDDGERVWLIDFEYAGNNEPSAELAGVVVGAELDGADIPRLVAAYDGTADPRRIDRIGLWRIVHLLLWSEWATTLEEGTWVSRLASAREVALADPDLEALIDRVART